MTTAGQKPPRQMLLVGTGAPGGIGRVEQLLAEAALASDNETAESVVAMWRREHPAYLRHDAISRLPTVGDPVGNGVRYAWGLFRALRSVRPDYVMYTHVNLARLAPLLKPAGHPRYGVWVYGIEVWTRLSTAHRRALRGADVVMTISRHSADRTINEQGVDSDRVQIVPLTLPEAMFAHDPVADVCREPGRILTVARLASTERAKNIDYVIRAMGPVHKRFPHARLVIVGDGDDRRRLEGVAHRIGASDIVQFLGHISDDELAAQYERADIFVLPSEKEGFGLVFVEAMLAGVPAVGLATGGPLDIIRDGLDGRLLAAPDELDHCLIDLLHGRDTLEAMRNAAQRRVRAEFSPAAFRTALVHALHSHPPRAPN